jgi:hypothetical protein
VKQSSAALRERILHVQPGNRPERLDAIRDQQRRAARSNGSRAAGISAASGAMAEKIFVDTI